MPEHPPPSTFETDHRGATPPALGEKKCGSGRLVAEPPAARRTGQKRLLAPVDGCDLDCVYRGALHDDVGGGHYGAALEVDGVCCRR